MLQMIFNFHFHDNGVSFWLISKITCINPFLKGDSFKSDSLSQSSVTFEKGNIQSANEGRQTYQDVI